MPPPRGLTRALAATASLTAAAALAYALAPARTRACDFECMDPLIVNAGSALAGLAPALIALAVATWRARGGHSTTGAWRALAALPLLGLVPVGYALILFYAQADWTYALPAAGAIILIYDAQALAARPDA